MFCSPHIYIYVYVHTYKVFRKFPYIGKRRFYTVSHICLYNVLYMTAILLKTHFNVCPPQLKNTFKHMLVMVLEIRCLYFALLPDTQWPLDAPKVKIKRAQVRRSRRPLNRTTPTIPRTWKLMIYQNKIKLHLVESKLGGCHPRTAGMEKSHLAT